MQLWKMLFVELALLLSPVAGFASDISALRACHRRTCAGDLAVGREGGGVTDRPDEITSCCHWPCGPEGTLL